MSIPGTTDGVVGLGSVDAQPASPNFEVDIEAAIKASNWEAVAQQLRSWSESILKTAKDNRLHDKKRVILKSGRFRAVLKRALHAAGTKNREAILTPLRQSLSVSRIGINVEEVLGSLEDRQRAGAKLISNEPGANAQNGLHVANAGVSVLKPKA